MRIASGRRTVHLALPLALALAAFLFSGRAREAPGSLGSLVTAAPVYGAVPPSLDRPAEPGWRSQVFLPLQVVLAPGQTLTDGLVALGVPGGEVYAMARQVGEVIDVRRMRPGTRLDAWHGPRGRLRRVEVAAGDRGRVRLEPGPAGWSADLVPFSERVEVRRAEGVVEGSLLAAVSQAGADTTVGYRLADVFQWDVDFNRDLQPGDRFEVLYEEVYRDGERHGVGQVVAAHFWNRGRRLDAYRFGEAGYYDGDGRPLRKMFLRSPLPFTRITSHFSRKRFHPILKTYRPHYGVDYGAPTGTPVRVTATGVVTFAGWDRGGGKTVKVRHPNGYVTAYLHLSRFASGIGKGSRVAQGDVVGHVGATGLATAPHLDYRVQHHGRWIDPLTLKAVPAEPLEPRAEAAFLAWRDALRESLESAVPPRMTEPDGLLLASLGTGAGSEPGGNATR